MKDWQSQAHVKWDCKYHVVILPKYRRKVLYGKMRRGVGPILRELGRQKDIELGEGKAMPDHIHLLLSVPPRYSIAMTIGYLKGQSATQIHRELLHTNGTVFGRWPAPQFLFQREWEISLRVDHVINNELLDLASLSFRHNRR